MLSEIVDLIQMCGAVNIEFVSVKFSWGCEPKKTTQPNFCGVRRTAEPPQDRYLSAQITVMLHCCKARAVRAPGP